MEAKFLKKLLKLMLVCVGLLVNVSQAAERVSLSGVVEQTFCPEACGICCPTHVITDTSGEITLQVGNSFADLTGLSGDKNIHKFTGSFYQTAGQCGVNECTLFVVETLDEELVAEAVYDDGTEELKVTSGIIKDTDSHYTFTLRPPFNTGYLVPLTQANTKAQTESCANPGDRCETGLACVAYYGVAGGNGPEFKTCEIPCASPGALCPTSQACVAISDGPGLVCRAD